MRLRRYVPLDGRFESSRSAGLVVLFVLTIPLLRPWLTTASRFLVAPPPCVFGATSRSIVDSNRLDRQDLSCSSCSRHRRFVLGWRLLRGFWWLRHHPSSALGLARLSIGIVSIGGTCRVLRAHGTAASSLADDGFAGLGGPATRRLRRYVSFEKSISIVSLGGTCRVLRAHDTVASSLADDCFAV